MKIKPRFDTPQGGKSHWPPDRDTAIRLHEPKYQHPDGHCQHDLSRACYTETGQCTLCTMKEQYEEAIRNPRTYPLTPGSPVAKELGYYLVNHPCHHGPHLLAKSLDGTPGCAICRQERKRARENSPRQAAIAAGETKYMPLKPCAKCGQTTLKRVDNGQCDGCRSMATPQGQSRDRRAMDEATEAVMQNNPEMVISRPAARNAGLRVFRTGRTCKNGHTGFRYTSSGKCIECERGRHG